MSKPDADFRTTIVHSLALASRLEGEGQYNQAKLLRAAVDSLLRRETYRVDLPYGVSSLVGDLMMAVSNLTSLDLDPDLVAAIQKGGAVMAEARLSLFDETPDAFVCRKCGYVLLQSPRESCPTCGAWAVTFQRFPPVYWLEALDPFTAMERLRQTPVETTALLYGLSEEQLSAPPSEGAWAIRQVISHMLDAQRVLHFRINLMLEHENPQLKSLAVFDWANDEKDRPASTLKILADYSASRQDTLNLLDTIRLADWWRMGLHQEFGAVTIRQQASYFAMHEVTHLTEIAKLRQHWLNAENPV
jgi:DinB superfamily